MLRNLVINFASTSESQRKVPQRFAADYGQAYKAIHRGAGNWRSSVTEFLKQASFVFIWNGLQEKCHLVTAYCERHGIPHAYYEYGMLPQGTTFYLDPNGFCGRSRLMGDLGWITPRDMELLERERTNLQAANPISDNGDILLPMQLFDDTQVAYNTPYETMHEFVEYMKTIFDHDRIVVRKHPQGGCDFDGMGVRVEEPGEIPFLKSAARCHAVVGLTSTCLMEAKILGKPVLALGDCPLRFHNPELHNTVAAGQLALTVDRQHGSASSILERFGLRPLGCAPVGSGS